MRNILWQVRRSRKISQSELAQIVGMKQNSISSLENQVYNPTLKHAMKIAAALGCSIYDIWQLDPSDWDGCDPLAGWLGDY